MGHRDLKRYSEREITSSSVPMPATEDGIGDTLQSEFVLGLRDRSLVEDTVCQSDGRVGLS